MREAALHIAGRRWLRHPGRGLELAACVASLDAPRLALASGTTPSSPGTSGGCARRWPPGTDFFVRRSLFAPVGADLTLHTHTALTAFVGATVLRHLSVVAALNVTILVSLALNGFCAYLLAWQLTRDWGRLDSGGHDFGTSPYIAAHLNGHFNLINAWTIPLFALTILPAMTGSRRWAALAGLVLAMTAYVDYYYVVYELALALCCPGRPGVAMVVQGPHGRGVGTLAGRCHRYVSRPRRGCPRGDCGDWRLQFPGRTGSRLDEGHLQSAAVVLGVGRARHLAASTPEPSRLGRGSRGNGCGSGRPCRS